MKYVCYVGAATIMAGMVGFPATAAEKCMLFPPPFDLNEGEAAAFFKIPPRMMTDGYWETPVFPSSCPELSKNIRITAAFHNSKTAALIYEGMARDDRDTASFDAFVAKYVGKIPEKSVYEPMDFRRYEWKKDDYYAQYSISPTGPDANGMRRVRLKITSPAFLNAAQEHYKAEENNR